jgi:hypothetical protein
MLREEFVKYFISAQGKLQFQYDKWYDILLYIWSFNKYLQLFYLIIIIVIILFTSVS